MVKAKTTKRQKDIKSKLIAAICMLLVSTIMMVSSTYAWFTLSTAPEVTGINTQVGANGNLEMALMPATGSVADIKSDVGDSLKDVKDRNITWGNLVTMQDADGNNVYGLNQITLYPSQLNVDDEQLLNPTQLNTAQFLSTPKYGADGRIEKLDANTLTSVYNGTQFVENTEMGVRAIGTKSGMSQRELDYRNALSNANRAQVAAQTQAINTLTTYGNTLADIVIKHATNKDTYTQDDVAALRNMVTGVEAAFAQAEKAYVQYILAGLACQTAIADDATWTAINSSLTAEGASLETVDALLAQHSLSIDSLGLGTARTALETSLAALEDADTKIAAMEAQGADATFGWADISAAVRPLADADKMQVNGLTTAEIRADMGKLVNSVQKEGGITVTIVSGGGVFADIADHCGDYTASVLIEEIRYDPIVLEEYPALMTTATNVNPPYLTLLKTGVSALTPVGSAGAQPLTTFYGYVIDMAFRTNASDSKLVLQQEATDRIYEDNQNNELTQGHGSSMTFKTESTDFSNAQMKELMKAIRIVFFDPATGNVIALAELDADNATVGPDGLTAYIKLYTVAETTETQYVLAGEGETATHIAVNTYVALAEGETGIYIFDQTLNEGQGGYRQTTGDETATHKLVVVYQETDTGATHKAVEVTAGQHIAVEGNELMTLTKGQAHALSVLVYLDGTVVENDDVATNAASLVGTMNLQFSSTANLVPMEYADLHPVSGNGGAETPDDEPVTP